MSQFDNAEAVLTKHAKDAIDRHRATIIQRFCEGAKKQNRNIKSSDVTGVTLLKLDKLAYAEPRLALGEFVIENAKDLHYLNGDSYDNNSSQPGQITFGVDETTTDTYTWSMTAGITVTEEASAELSVGVPGTQAKIGGKMSVSLSASTTAGIAHTHSRAWKKQITQPVAAFRHVDLSVFAQQVKGHVPFTLSTTTSGKAVIRISFNYYGSRTHDEPVDLKELIGASALSLVASGIINGLEGYKWYTDVQERDLSDDEKEALPHGLHASGDLVEMPPLDLEGSALTTEY